MHPVKGTMVNDFDGGRNDDDMCYDLESETTELEPVEVDFCKTSQNLKLGDFNGDHKDNSLCHDRLGSLQVAQSECKIE